MDEATRRPQFRGDGVRHATINGHRFHLRTQDATPDNFLWIDGKQPPIILDQTATDFVSFLIDAMWKFQQGAGDESEALIQYVVEEMFKLHGRRLVLGKNRVTRSRIKKDLHRIFGTLMAIAKGECPAVIGLEAKPIKYGNWNGPARMDLAVTYRCNLSCGKCYLGTRRRLCRDGSDELSPLDWMKIYEILWQMGVPQVVFTGGEPLLRTDIVELIAEADEFVTGLVTNGTQLANLAQALRDASLDYVQVTIESDDREIHNKMTGTLSHALTIEGIKTALRAGLQVVTNTTLTSENIGRFVATIEWLKYLGVANVACNSLICSGNGIHAKKTVGVTDEMLRNVLLQAREKAEKLGVNLQWYSPTCYSKGVNPLELNFGAKACSAASHNMLIDPTGDVYPCQSWPNSVGNILKTPWGKIWENPTCLELRENSWVDTLRIGCSRECLHFSACRGGCPLDPTSRLIACSGGGVK